MPRTHVLRLPPKAQLKSSYQFGNMLKEFDCKLITGTVNGVFKADLMCFVSKLPKKSKIKKEKVVSNLKTLGRIEIPILKFQFYANPYPT